MFVTSFKLITYINIIMNTWPSQEAALLSQRFKDSVPSKGYILFETGYGPSGLPHIGTFAEVARTSMVIKAFKSISKIPTKLFCVSDDMDGLRKIPDNIPNKATYARYLDHPLTSIPDPYNKYCSYGEYMNSKLIKFLDDFNFNYEFISATKYYQSGVFNKYLVKVLNNYDNIVNIMLPTLGSDRQKTYSPFLPICETTGRILQAKVVSRDLKSNTITYINQYNKKITTSVLNGKCKLQWKVDFAMRWAAFDVDYEIYGKDIQANVKIYNKLCELFGKHPPNQMSCELFLDADGHKISKSKGNGITIDQWLKYGNKESLQFFMYQSPKKAKKLCYRSLPKIFDEYLYSIQAFCRDNSKKRKLFNNPFEYIENIQPLDINLGKIDFTLLLNLINVCDSTDKHLLWNYINNLHCSFDKNSHHFIDVMLNYAINYFQDFIKPVRQYKIPNQYEVQLLSYLLQDLKTVDNNPEEIQNIVYGVSKEHNVPLNQWFQLLYETLLGSTKGPRIGTFFALYGLEKIKTLLDNKIKFFKMSVKK